MVELWLVIRLLATILLGWAALADLARRSIPRPAGYGLLLLGAVVLVVEEYWLGLACYLLTLWCTRGRKWRSVQMVAYLLAVSISGWGLVPLLMGLLAVSEAFRRGWLGGGDAQLALGLVALGPADWVVLWLAGVVVVAGLGVMFRRGGGLVGGLQRLWAVGWHLDGLPDGEAVRSPHAVLLLVTGVLYLWLLPLLERIA